LELPDPTSSIILFILKFCVGYVTILIAYYRANRLSEWLSLDVFDKTIITFIVGGVISVISFFGLNAPINEILFAGDSESTKAAFAHLSEWLSRNTGITIIIEVLLIAVVALSIVLFLERNDDEQKGYVV